MSKKTYKNAVIVGRFQVAALTPGHIDLIESVQSKFEPERIIIVLGISPIPFSYNNPLGFEDRKAMVEKYFPDVTIVSIKDVGNNDVWSSELNHLLINTLKCNEDETALCGSRDSFISSYKGKFATEELVPNVIVSGSVHRTRVGKHAEESEDFRRGIIYASQNRYPSGYPTMDCACAMHDGRYIFVMKPGLPGLRFPGGYFDPKQDQKLEDTAEREMLEETNARIMDIRYIFNTMVDDWRYRKEQDKILTTLFHATYDKGTLNPQDDISEIHLVTLEDARERMAPSHVPLLNATIRFRESLKKYM